MLFGVQADVPRNGGNSAQRREHDKRIGVGTMSRTGAACPCCGVIMTMEDIRLEGRAGRLGTVMTAVVVEGPKGKEYRLPTDHERSAAEVSEEKLCALYADIPFGLPEEQTPKAGTGASRAFSVDGYGFDTWRKLFTNRQLVALGTLIHSIKAIGELKPYPKETHFSESILAMLAIAIDRAADYMSTLCIWEPAASEIKHTFVRFALPITWDYAEGNPIGPTDRLFAGGVSNVGRVLDNLSLSTVCDDPQTTILCQSATSPVEQHDIIVTDPPYYDAIPYSDLMDFFHVWLRRTIPELSHVTGTAFSNPLGPKWDHDTNDGELIDDAGRFCGDRERSKRNYEDGMARAFQAFHDGLSTDGRLVVVFRQ